MAEKRPELSDAEWVVMKAVWRLKKTNVREVYEDLTHSHNWAYNTVRTMMERLREKGYLSAKKIGNTFFYQPRVSQRKISMGALERFADKVFNGAIGPIVAHLIQQDKLSDAEVEEIKRLLEEEEGES